MQMLTGGSRPLFIAAMVALFLVVAVDRPQAKNHIQNRAFGYHQGNALVSRAHETTDIFAGATGTTSDMYYVYPHPTSVNPEFFIGVSPGSGGISRFNTSNAGPIAPSATSIGTVKGGVYVNVGGMKPHYFAVSEYAGKINSSAVEFYDPVVHGVVETFLPEGTDPAPTSCTFCKTTTGPFYRWFWSDKAPTGITTETIYAIDLRDADVAQGGSGNPWDPVPASVGPPFSQLPTQMGTPEWAGKFFTAASISGNDDDSHILDMWTDPVSGANLLICGRVVFLSPLPPTWGVYIDVFDADSPTFPLPTVESDPVITAGIPEIFHGLRVVGNYVAVSYGKDGSSGEGGTSVGFWYVPAMGPPGTGAVEGGRGGFTLLGATGSGIAFDGMKYYVGRDNLYDSYGVAATNPATVGGTPPRGFYADTGGASPIASVVTHRCLTAAEVDMITPPDRTWPGNWWTTFEVNLDPVSNFPGTSTGAGRRSSAGACSGALSQEGSGLLSVLVVLLVVGLAGATLREAARR